MKGWRHDMFGIYAERLKRGELALKVDRGEVVLLSLGTSEAALETGVAAG
jgi:hypothetical protein